MTLTKPHAGQSKVIVHPGAYLAAIIRPPLHVLYPALIPGYIYGYGA